LRAAHDAILVGVGTVLADDPSLTVRLVDGKDPQPVVLDSHLRLPLGAKLLKGDRPLWIATTRQGDSLLQSAYEAAGARLFVLPATQDGRVALPALLERLAEQGIKRLMVEGGARVITSFIAQDLVDLVALTVAPRFVGGLPAVEGLQVGEREAPRLMDVSYERLGDDLVVWGKLPPRGV
jgi:3,4-dihydroxy 2-butanone 4-phosphate synthase/GTP cyclohydrolase II